ncbi:DUF3347 domain-containing protein, partial [Yeosuana marina]|uniref:DUF3347 domain-containing protein n=1 Tax=Yeosuana marina TaxID=1565536 RepID=UPI0030C7BB3A
MNNLKMSIAATLLLTLSFTNAQEKENMHMNHGGMKMDGMKMNMDKMQDAKAEAILSDYFNLKDALVADDTKKAAQNGAKLAASLKAFDKSNYTAEEQKELGDIIE